MKVSLDSRYFINQNSGFLGYMGEIDSREIIFENYEVEGADSYKLRISYSDGVQYDISIDDGKCVIHPSLLREAGFVELQVLAVAYSDGDFTYIKKSNVFKAEVKESLTGDTEPIPTYEEAIGALEKVLNIEESASKSANRAEEAATKAENVVGTVKEYSETAKTAAENAENSAKEASDSATEASKQADLAKEYYEIAKTKSEEASDSAIEAGKQADLAKEYSDYANTSAENAENSANSASESVTEASKQVDLAKAEVTKAQGFSDTAETWATESESSATKAKEYADNAETYSNSAQSAKSEAETAQKAAETSASEAADSLTSAESAAKNAVKSAWLASESEDNAVSAEISAESAMNSAKNYADSAAESESNAKVSADSAKDILDSIPADYSELSSDVASIKSELDEQIPLTKLEGVTGVMSYLVKVLRNKIINSTEGTWAIRDGDDDVYLFSKGLGFVVNDNSPTLEVYSETLKIKNILGATNVYNIASISDGIYLAVNKTGLHTLDFDFTSDSKIPYTSKDLESLPMTNFATYSLDSGINTYGKDKINCFAPFRLNGLITTENTNGYTIYSDDGSIARSSSTATTISANDEIVVIFTKTPDTARITFAKETVDTLTRTKADGIVETVEGKTITANDCSDMPLRGLKIFGKTTQVTTTGAQLFNPEWINKTPPSDSVVYNSDGTITVKSATSAICYLLQATSIPIEAGTYSTICYDENNASPGGFIRFYFSDGSMKGVGKNGLYTFTLESDVEITSLICTLTDSDAPTTLRIMLSKSTTQIPWEPYTGGQPSPSPDYPQELVSLGSDGKITVDISDDSDNHQTAEFLCPNGLPGIKVTSGGNYTDEDGQQWICDEIDLERGEYIQRILSVTLDDSIDVGVVNEKYFTFSKAQSPVPKNYVYEKNDISLIGLCKQTSIIKTKNSEQGAYGIAYVNYWRINLPNIDAMQGATADDLKAYLAENPLTVYYPTGSPVIRELTAEELTAYRNLHTNKLTTTFNSEAYMSVDYTADTKTYIDNKFTELQQALLSTGGDV